MAQARLSVSLKSSFNSLPECTPSDQSGRGTGSEGRCCLSAGCWAAAGSQTAEQWGLLEGSGACGDPVCHNGWCWGLEGMYHVGQGSRGISAPGDLPQACRSPTSDECDWPLGFSWLVLFRTWSLLGWVYRPGGRHLVEKQIILCYIDIF